MCVFYRLHKLFFRYLNSFSHDFDGSFQGMSIFCRVFNADVWIICQKKIIIIIIIYKES